MKILNVAGDALKFPPVIRGVLALVVIEYLLNALPRVYAPTPKADVLPKDLPWGAGGKSAPAYWLALTPGYMYLYPWTLVTSSFLEPTLLELAWTTLFLGVCGRYLERIWGSRAMLKFIGIVVVSSNIATVVVCFVQYLLLGAEGLWKESSFHGLLALQAGFLVALTQLMPEHQVILLRGLVKVRIKSLPMAYVTLSNIMCIVWSQDPWFLVQPGWLFSWMYLRFFKEAENGSFRGDQSETFSFANWFPPIVQPYVGRAANAAFDAATHFGVLKPWSNFDTLPVTAPASGTVRAEAERRRAMALATLDQRLASAKAMGAVPEKAAKNDAEAEAIEMGDVAAEPGPSKEPTGPDTKPDVPHTAE